MHAICLSTATIHPHEHRKTTLVPEIPDEESAGPFSVDEIGVEISENVCEVVGVPVFVFRVTAGVVTARLELFLVTIDNDIYL